MQEMSPKNLSVAGFQKTNSQQTPKKNISDGIPTCPKEKTVENPRRFQRARCWVPKGQTEKPPEIFVVRARR